MDIIKLNESQKSVLLQIAAKGANIASRHIHQLKSLPTGAHLYYHGLFISLKMAIKRRGRCIKLSNQILQGKLR